MVSSALSQLLERARLRFGVEVEILDAGLRKVYPDGGTDLARLIDASPAVRQSLLEAMAAGRPHQVQASAAEYRVYPLRRSPQRHASGLLAVRRPGSGDAHAADAEPWSEFARAVVEADLATSETLGEERQRSRKFLGTLRFLELVTEIADQNDLAASIVQAAAVWYDVDARIYRRNLAGDFVLHTVLPGVGADRGASSVPAAVFGSEGPVRRLASAGDLRRTAAGYEATVVPCSTSSGPDWMLALIGSVPSEVDNVLRLLGSVAGARFDALEAERIQAARAVFEMLLNDIRIAPELSAIRVVHGLAQRVNAGTASLTLSRAGRTRRVAAIGSTQGVDAPAAESHDRVNRPDRLARVLSFGGDDYALLELGVAPDGAFTPDAAAMTDACASILRVWLAGTLSSFDRQLAVLEGQVADVTGFSARIREELERAKRFDLRLSLVLIDVNAPSDVLALLQEAVRRELRGSDVTGAMSERRLAALLTHTDALGLENVVRRLKRRLVDEAERLKVGELTLGQAALSPDCRTADALLALAMRQAEPVIVH